MRARPSRRSSGPPEVIADALRAYAREGIGHVQLVVDPITEASVAALAPVLEALDRAEPSFAGPPPRRPSRWCVARASIRGHSRRQQRTSRERRPPAHPYPRHWPPPRSPTSTSGSSSTSSRTVAARSRRSPSDLGVSEAAVRARTNRLIEKGILQVVGVTDPLKLGFQQWAMIGVRVEAARLIEVAEEIAAFPETDYVVVTAGSYDILVEAVAEDNEALLQFLSERLRKIPACARPRRSCTCA